MSRSGYTDECDDQWALIRWRGAVASAIRGERGQSMLRELLVALDAMPEKRLAAGSLVNADGEFCTLGALGAARGIELNAIDPEDRQQVAKAFGVAEALAAEIMYLNDEGVVDDWLWQDVEICGPMRGQRHKRSVMVPNPKALEMRWAYMRRWAEQQITKATKEQP